MHIQYTAYMIIFLYILLVKFKKLYLFYDEIVNTILACCSIHKWVLLYSNRHGYDIYIYI